MRLATLRTEGGTRAVVRRGDELVELGYADVGALLREPDWRDARPAPAAAVHPLEGADLAPLVPRPAKIICVGHNYANHIREMGRELPTHPTLFPKFADTLVGADDDVVRPPETDALDWEVELTVVMGGSVRRATPGGAAEAIAGFTVMNDISVRDWQFRTVEWTQGKIWDSTTPVGPFLVTPEELPGGTSPELAVRTTVDGEVMQSDHTSTLLFDPVDLVRYVSTIIRLQPGDLIATGTPAGVGHARDPQVYLRPGQTVVAEVEQLGACRTRIVGTRP